MKRMILAASVCFGTASVFATTDVNWTAGTGAFDVPGNWNPSRVPAKGDLAQIKLTSTGTVTLPTGNYDSQASLRFNVVNDGTVLTWNGANTVFRQVETDTASYNDEPFGFRLNGSHFFNLQTYSDATAVRNKRPLSKISNGVLRLSVPSDGSASVTADFDAGDWNFFDPLGTAYATGQFYAGRAELANDVRMTFHAGTKTRFPQLLFMNNVANGHEMTLDFAGGSHEVMGKLDLPSQYGFSKYANTTTVSVTNGATLTFGDVATVGCTAHVSYGGLPHFGRTYRFLTSGTGSKTTFGGAFTHSTGGRLEFTVADGASVSAQAFNVSRSSNAPSTVRVTDASLTTTAVTLGSNNATNSAAVFAATNAVLNLGAYCAYAGEARIKDSSWTGTYMQNGFGTNTASVAVDGGSVNWGGSTYIGYEGPASLSLNGLTSAKLAKLYVGSNSGNTAKRGTVAITNVPSMYATHAYFGNADVDVYNSNWTNEYQFELGNAGADSTVTFHGGRLTLKQVELAMGKDTAGTSTLRLLDGATLAMMANRIYAGYVANTRSLIEVKDSTIDASNQTLYIGGAGAGELTLDGGSVMSKEVFLPANSGGGRLTVNEGTLTATTQIRVGFQGEGELVVNGGKVTTPQFFLGQNACSVAGTVPTIRQTGGVIEATTVANSLGVKVADNAARSSRLVLDGGVFSARRFFGSAGYAILHANGGTVRTIAAATDFIQDFDEAKLGAKGLTVDSAYDCTIPQAFADQDDAKGAGLLTLAGTGEKTLGAVGTVSRIAVVGGSAKVLPTVAQAAVGSSITVKNGASLSLVGNQTKLTIGSLTLGDATTVGVLAMDPGDVIEVTGDLNVLNGAVALNGDFAVGSDYGFISVAGDKSAQLADAWSRMRVTAGGVNGRAYAFSVRYDSASGKTVVKMTVAAADALTDATWTGAQGSAWTTDGSWSPAVQPTAFSRAVFGDAATFKDVTVSGLRPLAAMSFGSSAGYTVTGGGFGLTAHPLAAIDVTVGSNTVDSTISAASALPVTVASKSALVAGDAFSAETLVKKGAGLLSMTADDNAFSSVIVSNGTLSAAGPGSLGSADTLILGSAALSLGGAADVENAYPQKVTMDNPVVTDAVTFRANADVAMPAPTVNGGVTYKAGVGRLTWDVSENVTLAPYDGATGDWCPSSTSGGIVFDADGNIPSGTKLAGVNVGEGEIRVRGTKPGLTVNMQKYVMVGFPGATLDVAPRFTVDGVYLNANAGSKHFVVAPGFSDANTRVSDAYVTVSNNATLYCNTFYVSRYNGRTDMCCHILADRGVIQSSYRTHANCCWGSATTNDFVFRNGSEFLVGNSLNLPYRARFTFDGSVLAKNVAHAPAQVTVAADVSSDGVRAGGEFLFRNGSVFCCDSITAHASQTRATEFVFDNSEWVPGTGDFTFACALPTKTKFRVENTGLVLAPPSGKTWTMKETIAGPGGLVKRGAGTLVFGVPNDTTADRTLDFSGLAKVEAGVMKVSAGVARSDARYEVLSGAALDLDGAAMSVGSVSGAGRVRNGTLSGKMDVAVDDAWQVQGDVPTFESVGFGTFRVDLGRTAENPVSEPFLPVTVGRYTGAAPSVAGWRVKGTGLRNVRGVFVAKDGVITMTLEHVGLAIFIR